MTNLVFMAATHADAPEVVIETGLAKIATDDLPAEEQVLEFWRARRKKSTLAAYEDDLEKFMVFVNARTQAEAVRVILDSQARANRVILAYAKHLEAKGLSTATIRRRIYGGLAAVISVANTLGLIPWRLAVPTPKVIPLRDTKGPANDVISAVLAQVEKRVQSKRPFLAIRDRAMIYLMLGNGLRRGEVVGLDVKHVDLGEKTVKILGKGQVERQTVPIASEVETALKAWLDIRTQMKLPADGPLFVNHHGKRLSGIGLYTVLRDIAEKLNIKFPRPHGFRHYAITQVVRKRGAASAFAFARHSNMTMTMRYVDNLAEHAREGAQTMDDAIIALENASKKKKE